MNILTDDIVETGAKALHALGHGPLADCRAVARVCLAAALPEIAETCAKVIEETPSRLFAMTHHETMVADRSLNALNVKRELADRVRSLFGSAV